MTYCDRMHCHRTLGIARYWVAYWAEGVRVTDVRAFCRNHAEGVVEFGKFLTWDEMGYGHDCEDD